MFDLWRTLHTITQYQYLSQPGKNSIMGWAGSGKGRVETQLNNDTIYFTESGEFILSQNGYKVETSNEFIWSRVSNTRIKLYHSRFGREQKVELFELVYDSDSKAWESEQAHLCGDDIYSGKVLESERGLEFFWTIAGPRKEENLHYYYSR
ncbi:DUF6314 family protein [Vibrio gallicus]|uniref:DUF6314 family protein n=1 Tax=Vibrio gallicus TaxID=190897 RepID=UPI0021C3346E|nr:DUF6314 family protein [Vibrio gallicus]